MSVSRELPGDSTSAAGRASREGSGPGLLGRWGAALSAVAAAAAALPALRLPFLADDWINLLAVDGGVPLRTPFGYFRPLYLATYGLDRLLWGLSPAMFHLTSLMIIAAGAGMVVALLRRYTRDDALATLAGLLFAIHPAHVESAAWIAARADPLAGLLLACAALSYDVWRERSKGVPLAAMALFETALLAKESAVALPGLLVLPGLCDARRRPGSSEWLRGHLPMFAVALVHFLWLRPLALGGWGLRLLGWIDSRWAWKLLGFSAASLIPAPLEALERWPLLFGTLAAGTALSLALVARARSGRIPAMAWAAGAAFLVLIAPCLISFQGRYLFVPTAASALGLASLVRAARGRLASAICALIVCGWGAAWWQWTAWGDSGIASERLVAGLIETSRREGVQEIIVANLPYRVHGAPVVGDFEAALALSGGRRVRVRAAATVDLPSAAADALDGPRDRAVRVGPDAAEVRLRIPEGLFSRYDGPDPDPGADRVVTGWATVIRGPAGSVTVRIPRAPDGSRAACLWHRGRLATLF